MSFASSPLSTSSVLCHRPRTKRFPRVPAGRRSIETARLSRLNHRTVRTLSRGKRCPSRVVVLDSSTRSFPRPRQTPPPVDLPLRSRVRSRSPSRAPSRSSPRPSLPETSDRTRAQVDAIVVRFRRVDERGRHRYLFRFLFPDEISFLSFFLSFALSFDASSSSSFPRAHRTKRRRRAPRLLLPLLDAARFSGGRFSVSETAESFVPSFAFNFPPSSKVFFFFFSVTGLFVFFLSFFLSFLWSLI